MSLAVIFGTNLRNRRKAKRLTQAELAEKVSLSTEMISKIERGVASPSFANIEKLSEVLGVSSAVFFGDDFSVSIDDDRSQILSRIALRLSRLNGDQLARLDKIIAAIID